MARLSILKTYKLFIDGKFPRSESGRYYALKGKRQEVIANVCLASRKDFRNAVSAARNAFPGWNERPAMNRAQIMYRMAEMLEGRTEQLTAELVLQGISVVKAKKEVSLSIDRLVYYAGWCDKYQQIFSAVNPVATLHHNFSVPGATGVVNIIAPAGSGLLGLISVMAPVIAGGNTCTILASGKYPLSAITLAEALLSSDLPNGVVNILTGSSKELHGHFSSHMDVNAIIYCNSDKEEIRTIMENCSLNIKRFFHLDKNWMKEGEQGPYYILDLQEIKTTWHPVERAGGAAAKY